MGGKQSVELASVISSRLNTVEMRLEKLLGKCEKTENECVSHKNKSQALVESIGKLTRREEMLRTEVAELKNEVLATRQVVTDLSQTIESNIVHVLNVFKPKPKPKPKPALQTEVFRH